MEILTTLMAGGTVCVISEAERSRMMLNGACPLTVTHAFLTPSVSGLLDAGRASWVETLVLLGEPMSTSHIKQWANVCRLVNAYGPTECAVLNTSTGRILPGDDPKNMGHSLGVHFWVVDQNDHNRLLPIGAVGELMLSGPPVGKGYVGDAKKSASAFIQPPRWLQQLFPEASSWRLYKTGDLVRYDISSGCLRYEGRKDRQIKVRGQRVELEDIEHHTRRYFPRAADVVVEQVKLPEDLPTGTGDMSTIQPRIIACVCWKRTQWTFRGRRNTDDRWQFGEGPEESACGSKPRVLCRCSSHNSSTSGCSPWLYGSRSFPANPPGTAPKIRQD